MRKLALWTAPIIVLSFCVHVEAQGQFGPRRRPVPRSIVEKKEAEPVDTGPAPIVPRESAQAALLRRQDVVLRLRELALQTGDEELSRKIDTLEEQVWQAYLLRTGASAKGDGSAVLESRLAPDASAAVSRLTQNDSPRPGQTVNATSKTRP